MNDDASQPRSSTALALGRLLADGALDPRAVCEQAIAATASAPARHAFITVTADRARAEAERSAERLRDGRPASPLDGVPIAWKDLFDVRGTRTTAGSETRRDAPPAATDAPAVARLAAAGMVCIGKTNLTELAFSGLGLNAHFGTPRNPRGEAAAPRIPGGSSSGAAVAVAAGVVPCAIGTDTSGSVRVPAALCGLVGFKPTAAAIDRTGILPLAPTIDSVGALAHSVTDVAAIDRLLRGLPAHVPEPAPLDRLRLAVPDGELVEDLAPDVRARFEAAMRRLHAAGATIERRPLHALVRAQELMDVHGSLVSAEAARTHAALFEQAATMQLLDPRIRTRLEQARDVLKHGLAPLLAARAELQALLREELDGALAVFPTVRHTAPLLAPLERDDELFARVNLRTLRSTMVGSYLDMPGVTLPIGCGDHALPVGLLVSGPPKSDEPVLSAALAIERVLDPHEGGGTAPTPPRIAAGREATLPRSPGSSAG
ncbi:MAG TPA: amidase family protein [Conexibacter sp.]|nr:amidase family protein [Conexibacter sp.]